MASVRFPIRVGRRSWPVLMLFGVRRDNAWVELDGDLDVRFGWYRFRTPTSNLATWRIEGPWRWITAIGVRKSIRHDDVTFGGSPHAASGSTSARRSHGDPSGFPRCTSRPTTSRRSRPSWPGAASPAMTRDAQLGRRKTPTDRRAWGNRYRLTTICNLMPYPSVARPMGTGDMEDPHPAGSRASSFDRPGRTTAPSGFVRAGSGPCCVRSHRPLGSLRGSPTGPRGQRGAH